MLEYVSSFLGTALLGVIAWSFQLNSRISVLEQQHVDLKELINLRFDATDSRLYNIDRGIHRRNATQES